MFEAQLAYYLNRYLGTYVQGLDTKSLKISVFKGDVTLTNLKLKPEALADLNLPITVKAGLLGSLTLKVGILKASFLHPCPHFESWLVRHLAPWIVAQADLGCT